MAMQTENIEWRVIAFDLKLTPLTRIKDEFETLRLVGNPSSANCAVLNYNENQLYISGFYSLQFLYASILKLDASSLKIRGMTGIP
jgi:hypothetical protein